MQGQIEIIKQALVEAASQNLEQITLRWAKDAHIAILRDEGYECEWHPHTDTWTVKCQKVSQT